MAWSYLDGLVGYVTTKVLKEDYKNCKVWNTRVRSLRELQKVYK